MEANRQAKKRQELLSLLRSNPDGVTNVEMSKRVSLRYGAHLGTLYQLGYKISKMSLGNGVYKYQLIEEPEQENHDRKKALDVLIEAVNEEEIVDSDMLISMLDKLGIAVKYKPNTYTA